MGEFRHMRGGVPKPILWVVDGCGLHEMEFCSERRFQLPNYVLARFPPKVLREAVVWQTVGAGFLMKDANRFKGACSSINADQVAAQELAYLRAHQVRHYNYTRVSLQYAPLMFDAIHFTYYWVPCAQTFPELARMVAQARIPSLPLPASHASRHLTPLANPTCTYIPPTHTHFPPVAPKERK